jgi:hypothetical protein
MNPIRTHRTPARKQFFLVSPRLIIHPVEEIKPNIFLVFPLVLGHDFVESLENALVTNWHCFDGIAGEGYAGSNLAEMSGCLVDGDGDAAFVEGDA